MICENCNTEITGFENAHPQDITIDGLSKWMCWNCCEEVGICSTIRGSIAGQARRGRRELFFDDTVEDTAD